MGAANTILRPADGLAHEDGRAGRHDGGARACRRRGNARLARGRERHYLAFSTCRRPVAQLRGTARARAGRARRPRDSRTAGSETRADTGRRHTYAITDAYRHSQYIKTAWKAREIK